MNGQLDRLEKEFDKFFGRDRLPPIRAPEPLPVLTPEQLAEGDLTEELR